MNFKTTSISLGILFLLTGCVSSTPLITPKYDKKSKTLTINNVVLDNVTYYTKKESRPANNLRYANSIKWYNEKINLENEFCNKVSTKISTSNQDKFYTRSCKEDVENYYNGNCKMEKIPDTNIYLGHCKSSKKESVDGGEEKTITKTVYGICQSEPKSRGYGTKVKIGLYDNKKCFDYIKEKLTTSFKKKNN